VSTHGQNSIALLIVKSGKIDVEVSILQKSRDKQNPGKWEKPYYYFDFVGIPNKEWATLGLFFSENWV